MIDFITEHKDLGVADGLRWGVEPLCRVLTEHDIKISAATYYEWVTKKPSKQQLRDEAVVELIRSEREHPQYGRFASTLGSRKMWIRLRGQGHDVARCTVERLMQANGWEGARYGKKHVTTNADDSHDRSPDLVDRNFNPVAPNRSVEPRRCPVPPVGGSLTPGRSPLGVAQGGPAVKPARSGGSCVRPSVTGRSCSAVARQETQSPTIGMRLARQGLGVSCRR